MWLKVQLGNLTRVRSVTGGENNCLFCYADVVSKKLALVMQMAVLYE